MDPNAQIYSYNDLIQQLMNAQMQIFLQNPHSPQLQVLQQQINQYIYLRDYQGIEQVYFGGRNPGKKKVNFRPGHHPEEQPLLQGSSPRSAESVQRARQLLADPVERQRRAEISAKIAHLIGELMDEYKYDYTLHSENMADIFMILVRELKRSTCTAKKINDTLQLYINKRIITLREGQHLQTIIMPVLKKIIQLRNNL